MHAIQTAHHSHVYVAVRLYIAILGAAFRCLNTATLGEQIFELSNGAHLSNLTLTFHNIGIKFHTTPVSIDSQLIFSNRRI